MSKGWYYESGNWNAICDVCGQKHKALSLKKRWDGFMVCAEDWEERHPQDFVRAKQDKISVPWTRPKQPDIFITVPYVNTNNNTVPSGNNHGEL